MQISLTIVLNYTKEHKFTWSILSVMYKGTTSRILSKFLLALLWWALLTYYFADNSILHVHELFLVYYKTPRITWSFIISIADVCTEECSSNILETKLIVRNCFLKNLAFMPSQGFADMRRRELTQFTYWKLNLKWISHLGVNLWIFSWLQAPICEIACDQ